MNAAETLDLFARYLSVTGVAHLGHEPEGEPDLLGKRLGLLNGSAWISLWANYFGRRYLPGVQLVSAGNDAVQLNFMGAHARGEPCPPAANIEAFVRQARDLIRLGEVDAILMTCSTMNRAYPAVARAVAADGVPVVQIDAPMMEAAVQIPGTVLVVATHGPTVDSTCRLLEETAQQSGRAVTYAKLSLPDAWECLAAGDAAGHNRCLEQGIRAALDARPDIGCVVLAQLSMALLLVSLPEADDVLGVPVLTSAACGFGRVRKVLHDRPARAVRVGHGAARH
jgi:hypothetical protein